MPTHERYETGLALTGHRFFAVRTAAVKDWNRNYAPVPPNYVLLNPLRGSFQIPPEVDFDLVLSQNKFGQFQIAASLARQLHLPLVSLEHTLPVPSWPQAQLDAMRQLRGDVNVFISEYSRGKWGWSAGDAEVVRHGVDSAVFSPPAVEARRSHALSVVNDWVNRDWCCGFKLWQEVTANLPTFVVGDTPGLSLPTASVRELVGHYQQAQVFVNTSLVSPVPTALLEAMACGCAVVTTANCMIPEIVQDGVNGFLSNDPRELRSRVELLLRDEGLARKLGEAARRTVVEHFSMQRFVSRWDEVLRRAVTDFIYKG